MKTAPKKRHLEILDSDGIKEPSTFLNRRIPGELVNHNARVGDVIAINGREFFVDQINHNAVTLIGEQIDLILSYEVLFDIEAIFIAFFDEPFSYEELRFQSWIRKEFSLHIVDGGG